MNIYVEKQRHSNTWRWFGLILLFFVCTSAFAQNTKGDKPIRPLPRIAQKSKLAKGKKVKSNARNISGRRLHTKNKSTAARAIVSNTPSTRGRRSSGGDRPAKPIGGGRIKIRSSSAQLARNNVYPNKGPHINNPSRKPRKSERSFPNASPIGKARLLSRPKAADIPPKSRVAPISASRPYLSRGKKNVYWGKFSKGEKPFTKDISGRPLRTKNFRTPPIGLVPQPNIYRRIKRAGDKSGGSNARPVLSTSSSGRAWKGNISGHPIRKNSSKNRIERAGEFFFPRKRSTSKNRKSNTPLPGSGLTKSVKKGRSNAALSSVVRGGANVGSFKGTVKRKGFGGHRKSGGSISNQLRSNNKPTPSRIPLRGAAIGGYKGNIKINRLAGFYDQGTGFSGKIKAKRPLKAGGSVSGKSRSNNGNAIAVRIPSSAATRVGTYGGNLKSSRNYLDQGEEFTGFIKARKPLKGGGSISGISRNNKGNPIVVRIPTLRATKAGAYSGNIKASSILSFIKAKKPAKGGGSVSGKPWNNKENPIYARIPSSSKAKSNEYPGRARLTKNYLHNPRGSKEALKVIAPSKAYAKSSNYQGNLKMSKPHGSNLHPDAKFAHGRINNVKHERTILTNAKLWWFRLFKKSDTQPNAVKEKVRRPRYDKKERELWKDLYD
ncbi:MAG: hypothetical protein ORN54_03805 [Cyclobacteriaceae bacterium]|nr:hypothetical protein [Cyclobacteriaceae bacterium]